jgi:hypothetical protein
LRAIIESTAGPAVHFNTEGNIVRQQAQPPAASEQVNVNVTWEGWRIVP